MGTFLSVSVPTNVSNAPAVKLAPAEKHILPHFLPVALGDAFAG